MTKIFIIKRLANAIIFTYITLAIGQTANARQLDIAGQKEFYWSVGKSELVVKAGRRLEAEKPDQAKRLYRKALKTTMRENDRLIAYINLSVIHNGREEYETALKYSNKALKISANNWLAINNRGTAHFGLDRYEQAQKDFTAALALKPDDESLKYNVRLTQGKITSIYAEK